MKMSKKTDVVEQKNQLPVAIDYGADESVGFEGIGRDEIGIPFLKIMQAQCPEVIGPSGKIDGAEVGMLLNTGTETLSDSITLVPAIRQHVFVEWRPKKLNGGIAAVYEPGDPAVKVAVETNRKAMAAGEPSRKPGGGTMRFGELYAESGYDLVETFYMFAVVLEDDKPAGYIVVPFSSSQIKKYKKKFMNRAGNCLIPNETGVPKRPPMFAHRIVITTEDETNDEGTWKGYVIKFAVENNVVKSAMKPNEAGYQAGQALHGLVKGGKAEADLSKAGTVNMEGGEEDSGEQF